MSKKLLLIALTAFSVTAISAGGASANELGFTPDPIVREHSSVPGAPELFRFLEEGMPRNHGAQGAESENRHVAKTGLWSGIKKVGSAIKSGAKKVGKAVATGAKRAGSGVVDGVKKGAKAVAKSPLGTMVKKTATDIKNTAVKVGSAVKKYFKKRS